MNLALFELLNDDIVLLSGLIICLEASKMDGPVIMKEDAAQSGFGPRSLSDLHAAKEHAGNEAGANDPSSTAKFSIDILVGPCRGGAGDATAREAVRRRGE